MRARSIAAAAFFVGCGAASEPAGPRLETVDARPTSSTSGVVIAEAAQPNIPPPLLVAEGTLDERIERASKAMRDTQFRDVAVIIELSRLQLVRDNKVADSDGADDVVRGKKNAQRAAIVDAKSPETRLLLALATAQTFRKLPGSDEAQVRAARLKLVELAASAVPKSEGATEAATRSLAGFIALEHGDRAAARAKFESATALDPQLAAGWAGLGDALRSGKDYPRALEAYRKAAALLPDDKGIEEGMALAEKGVVLELPKVTAGGAASVGNGEPLAPDATAPPSCSGPSIRSTGGQELCAGLDTLARARTAKQFEDGANSVVGGFQSLRSFCEQKDPACGDFVAPALLAAGRGFRSAHLLAKSIAAFRILASNASLPGGKDLAQTATLEIADAYLNIGVFDEAASWYERYARDRGPGFEKARDRAAFIRSAFQDTGGPPLKPSNAVCRSPLLCGVRYLLAEQRWAATSRKP